MPDERPDERDMQLDERLARAGARWREANPEPARVDLAAIAAMRRDDGTRADADVSGAPSSANGVARAAAGDGGTASEPLPLVPEPVPHNRRPRTRVWVASVAGLAAAIAATIIAVQLGGGSSGTRHPVAGAGSNAPLIGTDWILTSTDVGQATVTDIVTLQLSADGVLSVTGDCNGPSGTRFESTGDVLTINQGPHFQMSCGSARDALEEALNQVLAGTVHYAIGGETLTITKDGVGTLTYTARRPPTSSTDPAAIEGINWQLTAVQLGDNIAQPYGAASSAPVDSRLAFLSGRLVGSDVCNAISGKVELGPGTISLPSGVGTTYELCVQRPTVTSQWTLVLQGVTHWTLTGDRLTLTDDHGGRLVFTNAADLGSGATPTATAPASTASAPASLVPATAPATR